MGLINSGSKSNRLLASRRFTSVDLNTSQEAFTSTLDIQASEVYTEANLIPTSSLPFSGSSSHLSQFSVNGHNIVKYYFRSFSTSRGVYQHNAFISFKKNYIRYIINSIIFVTFNLTKMNVRFLNKFIKKIF